MSFSLVILTARVGYVVPYGFLLLGLSLGGMALFFRRDPPSISLHKQSTAALNISPGAGRYVLLSKIQVTASAIALTRLYIVLKSRSAVSCLLILI